MKIPKDNNSMRKKYDNKVCGQSCLAVIEGISVKKVLENWIKILGEFKGYSPYKDTRKYLESRGYETKQERFDKNKFWNMEKFFLVRVQWLGNGEKRDKPYYGWGSWYEASNYTHYLLVHDGKVFCNDKGIFDFGEMGEYLEEGNGVITSLISIRKRKKVGKERKRKVQLFEFSFGRGLGGNLFF